MNNIYIGLFNDNEIEQIHRSISDQLLTRKLVKWEDKDVGAMYGIYRIDPDMGRLLIENLPLNKNIIEKANNAFKEDLVGFRYVGTMYCKYASEYGKPNLNAHIDRGQFETICIDYQLESNTDWPLTIEGKSYKLKDNDAISFHTKKQLHGRENKTFNNSEYVTMLFMYFDRIE